jgi:hypothetical protein
MSEAKPANQCRWAPVETILLENYESPDIEAAKGFYSVVAGHRIEDYSPCWLLQIAPSGSMKTDLVESLRGLPNVHLKDEVTAKTFISGQLEEGRIRKQSASLLHRIGSDGILAVADFSTFVCQDPKTLQTVLAQLRRIYDGNYSREFGTDENLEDRAWTGRLTFIAGATPDIDRHYRIFQLMGERFVRLRMPRAGGIKPGLKALSHRKTLLPCLREAVSDLFSTLPKKEECVPPSMPPAMSERIVAATELVCLARTYVQREHGSREMVCEPCPEGNTRLPQQVAQLGRGWALLNGRSTLGEEEFQLVHRACLDSIPPDRRQVLAAIENGASPYGLHLPNGSVSRAVEDLKSVGVLANTEIGSRLSDNIKPLVFQAVGSSHFFSRPRFFGEDRNTEPRVLAESGNS